MVQQVSDSTQQESALNREEMVQLGIQTARSGNADGARMMFQQVLGEDPRNERALMWMAALATSKAEKRKYLKTVLRVNPDSAAAQRELAKMAKKKEATNNRTLLYGGIFIGVLVLVSILGIIGFLVVTSMLG